MLANGDRFPAVVANDLDGREVTLPDVVDGGWSTILFYRGHW